MKEITGMDQIDRPRPVKPFFFRIIYFEDEIRRNPRISDGNINYRGKGKVPMRLYRTECMLVTMYWHYERD